MAVTDTQQIELLLVEDNPGDARLVAEALGDAPDFHTRTVESLAAAFEHLSDGRTDVVLLDLGLPDSSGLDTLLAVLSAHPGLPVVVLTGNDDEEYGREAVREGAQDYLTKSMMPTPLLARVLRYAMERQRSQEELRAGAERLRKTVTAVVLGIGTVLEVHDPYTAGHQRGVVGLSAALARQMGLETTRCEIVELAAAVHDIGKIAIPTEILNKPGALTPNEFRLVSSHAGVGADMLITIGLDDPIPRIVREHHERLDGSGYPSALRGEDTLLESRILAVADVFDAMCKNRPHRPALGPETALREIRDGAGGIYDDDVAAACAEVLAAGFELHTEE